jgi:peptidoglycan hydrolase-like protein with peptidoglycan-binding domain
MFGTPAEQKAVAETVVAKAQEPKTIDTSIANGKPKIIKDYKGKAVKEAQDLLTKHGFQCRPDGDFGPKTQEVVKQFQKSKSIPITGEVDELTWAALLS